MPHLEQLPLAHRSDILAIDPHFARVGSEQPDKVLEQDAFAAAAASDDDHALAGVDPEGNAVEHRLAAKTFDKIAHLDHVPNKRFSVSVRKKLLMRMVIAE